MEKREKEFVTISKVHLVACHIPASYLDYHNYDLWAIPYFDLDISCLFLCIPCATLFERRYLVYM